MSLGGDFRSVEPKRYRCLTRQVKSSGEEEEEDEEDEMEWSDEVE